MNSSSAISSLSLSEPTSVFRTLVLARFGRLKHGQLELLEGGQRRVFGAPGTQPSARVVIHDPRAYQRIALAGTLGAGEAYVDGHWDTPDLTQLIRLMLRNSEALEGIESGFAKLGMLLARGFGSLHRNTRPGSKRNIAAHYDLGNDFFERMLDPTLSYSSGVFEHEHSTLEQASHHKLELLCRLLELSPTDRLLEIGTGWGGLALHAAGERGAHVTTATISRQQYELAKRRVEALGLEERVEVLLRDYRDLAGTFDKLVSVEMIEAVGADYYDTFFGQCDRLLKPGGLFALQSITLSDQAYRRHVGEVDFIKRHIFPGSNIPSLTVLCESATRSSSLRVREVNDYGLHYARTLIAWRANLAPHQAWVVARYGEQFWRMWMFYLSYCEAGFAERYISVKHLLLEKPNWRQS